MKYFTFCFSKKLFDTQFSFITIERDIWLQTVEQTFLQKILALMYCITNYNKICFNVYQVCPGEAENITHLLKLCDKTDRSSVTAKMLTGISEGVCRPLKSRIEQILVSESSAIVLYKLTNLLRFYENTIFDILKCKFFLFHIFLLFQ